MALHETGKRRVLPMQDSECFNAVWAGTSPGRGQGTRPLLARMTQLKSLTLSGLTLDDELINSLSGLNKLKWLYFDACPGITKAGIERLRIALGGDYTLEGG